MSEVRFGASTQSLGDVTPRLGERHRLVVWRAGEPTRWPLPSDGTLTVGRDPALEVVIDSPRVSRRHAQLRVEGSEVLLVDLDSRNATRVNGELVKGERSLAYGDVITFGDVLAVIEEHRSPSAAAADAELPPDGLVLDVGGFDVVVADSAMLHVYSQLQRLAQSQLAVLLVGETGAGKEIAATALHVWSKRSEKRLVRINCAALPESLAESELFGYERGAFSGATRDKAGLLESAAGGTVFLDEIGDLSLPIQAKLLRVLESRQVVRLGSVHERAIDARIVSATHRDLTAAVAAGTFRHDLYFRISAAMVELPPLRARVREIPRLARRFFADASRKLGHAPAELPPAALAELAGHNWPGNVRELKNLMEYVAALVEGPVRPEDFAAAIGRSKALAASRPATTSAPESTQGLREAKSDLERRTIEAALDASGGNRTRAAQKLDMPLRTLTWKLKRLGFGKKGP
jgi:transcriptional regulator with PAS, ATPase and Fis domain